MRTISRRNNRRTQVLLSIGILITIFRNACAVEEEIANRSITAELVKSSDLSLIPGVPFTISIQPYQVKSASKSSAYSLLKARGIRPDTESLTLLYDVNPKLSSADQIPPNTRVLLPTLSGGTKLTDELRNGGVVMLTVDREIKDQLFSAAEKIGQLAPKFAALDSGTFGSIARQHSTDRFVQDLSYWLTYIARTFRQRTGRPMTRESLAQISREAYLVQTLLDNTINEGSISIAGQDQIAAVHEDMALQVRRFDEILGGAIPPRERIFKVVVNIIGAGADLSRNLRVYYVENGFYQEPPKDPPVPTHSFSEVGSGKTGWLDENIIYQIWAAPDGNPGDVVTVLHKQEGDTAPEGEVITIDLTLRPEKR